MSPLAPSATAQLPTWHRPHLPNTPHIFLSAVAGDAPDPSLEPISSFLHLLPIPDTAVCGVCHQIAPHHGMYVSLGSRTSSCQPPWPNYVVPAVRAVLQKRAAVGTWSTLSRPEQSCAQAGGSRDLLVCFVPLWEPAQAGGKGKCPFAFPPSTMWQGTSRFLP